MNPWAGTYEPSFRGSFFVVAQKCMKVHYYIVVAGRHRRTLRTLAIECGAVESEKLANIGDIGTESGRKTYKICKYHLKG